VGPTPVNKLIVRGEVVGRDDISGVLLLSITEMISIPKKPVRDYINHRLITIPASASVADALITLARNDIHGAPVEENGKIVGMITYTDIGRALSNNNSGKVADYMTRNVISIEGSQPMYEAVALMNKSKVGRLLVTEDGKPKGMITRVDVISRLTTY
jgi:predicted transcriptional regulator